jgi:hypothetical protein
LKIPSGTLNIKTELDRLPRVPLTHQPTALTLGTFLISFEIPTKNNKTELDKLPRVALTRQPTKAHSRRILDFFLIIPVEHIKVN